MWSCNLTGELVVVRGEGDVIKDTKRISGDVGDW